MGHVECLEMNLDICSLENSDDPDELASDQDPYCFPFGLWVHGTYCMIMNANIILDVSSYWALVKSD